jgi:hypothetical protein
MQLPEQLPGMDILLTEVDATTKTISAQLGNATLPPSEDNKPAYEQCEFWQHIGFSSRPATVILPSANAPQALTLARDDYPIIYATRDTRGQEIRGNMGPGETCLYASGADGTGQARVLLKSDSSINLYTQKDGAGMAIQITPASDTISLVNSVGNGIIINADGVFLVVNGAKAGLSIKADGSVSLIATGQAQVDGSSIVLGSNVLPVVSAALSGPSGMAGKASLKTLIE